jgi:DNA repair exonuclease SbcCD ATPase subunit
VSRTTARRIADLRDQRALLEKQLKEARTKYEAGVSPADSIAKLEVEIRRVDREIEDLSARLAEGSAGRSMARASVEREARSSIIDTSFTMDVGETVVVGTSRLKGGSRALIALLTAVPPRGTTEHRE